MGDPGLRRVSEVTLTSFLKNRLVVRLGKSLWFLYFLGSENLTEGHQHSAAAHSRDKLQMRTLSTSQKLWHFLWIFDIPYSRVLPQDRWKLLLYAWFMIYLEIKKVCLILSFLCFLFFFFFLITRPQSRKKSKFCGYVYRPLHCDLVIYISWYLLAHKWKPDEERYWAHVLKQVYALNMLLNCSTCLSSFSGFFHFLSWSFNSSGAYNKVLTQTKLLFYLLYVENCMRQ